MLGTSLNVNHVILPPDDDGISDTVSPPDGFKAFGRTYSDIYVRMLYLLNNRLLYVRPCMDQLHPLPLAVIIRSY